MGWKVVVKEGTDLVEAMRYGLSSRNSELVYEKNGIPVLRLMNDKYLAEILNARMPKVKEIIRTPKAARVVTRDFSRGRKLYAGSSPFRQLIIDEVESYERRKKYISVDELADIIAKETDEKTDIIKNLIIKMNRAGQLIIRDGNVFVGIRHPELGVKRAFEVHEHKSGVHPVKGYIYKYVDKYVDNYGIRTYKQIEKEMMDIMWIKRRSTLISYLKEMVKEGCLRKIGGIEGEYGHNESYETVLCGKY